MAKASDAKLAKGEGGALEGIPLGIKDLFAHRGRPHPGVQPCAGRLQAALQIDRHGQSVGRRRGDARQAQHGRVRHGLVQRDVLLRPGRQSVAAFAHRHGGHADDPSGRWRFCQRRRREDRAHAGQSAAGARRLVGRLGRGGVGFPVRGGHRHRHRRLDPPAGRLHRHGRHQADLRPLLALGHRRLRLVARPGRPDRPRRARRRDPAEVDGLGRSEGHHLGRPPGAGLRGGDRPVDQGHEGRHSQANTASTACPRRSRRCGRRALPG